MNSNMVVYVAGVLCAMLTYDALCLVTCITVRLSAKNDIMLSSMRERQGIIYL